MLALLPIDSGITLSAILRLTIAAILGGIIGLEREIRHKPAGLRTNMFICFGSALFTMLSNDLAAAWGGDHTRIAAQIIAGIGFIGAGSILHERGSVTGLTSAATIFVSAAIGMAAGGSRYVLAIFATCLILLALTMLGRLEGHFEKKRVRHTFEITGRSTDVILTELNRILSTQNLIAQDVHAAPQDGSARVVFSISGLRDGHTELNTQLHQSSTFASVQFLGATDPE